MSEIDDIYTNIIMEHSMNSQNRHLLPAETCSVHGHNPNCGDDIVLHILFDGDKIKDLSFTGSGCAISQSSTSVMADVLRGKTMAQANQIIDAFVNMIDRKPLSSAQQKMLGEAVAFKNIANMPARVKCALLSWKTLQNKLAEQSTTKW